MSAIFQYNDCGMLYELKQTTTTYDDQDDRLIQRASTSNQHYGLLLENESEQLSTPSSDGPCKAHRSRAQVNKRHRFPCSRRRVMPHLATFLAGHQPLIQ